MSRPWLIPTLAVIAAGLIVWLAILLLRGDDVSLTVGEPQVVTAAELESFADDAEHPVYWLGERADAEYELTETSSGRIFVRYLSGDGDEEVRSLTVGTYPVEDGVAALRRTAVSEDGKELARSDGGAVLLIDTAAPDNVHMAYPREDHQIEIYSPVPGQALRLASRDRVRPVP